MEISKSVNLFANAKIGEKVVANLSGNVNNNKQNYNINVNFVDKALIESSPENQALYDEQYNTFLNALKEYLV